jgi:Flp pilus assembly protein TadG
MRHRTERGQGLVEIALVLPLFLLALFAIVDFGHAVFAYSTLTNAASTGARAGIVLRGPSPTCDSKTKAECAVAIAQAFAGVGFNGPVVVTASCVAPCKIGSAFTVEGTGKINLVTPLVSAYVGGITVKANTTMTVEGVAP